MKIFARIGFAFSLQLFLSCALIADNLIDPDLRPNLVLFPIESEGWQIDSQGILDSYRSIIADSLSKDYNVFTGGNIDKMLQAEFDKQCKIGGDAESINAVCIQNVVGANNAELAALARIIKVDEGYLVTLEINSVFGDVVKLVKNYNETCAGCDPIELTDTFRNMIANADSVKQCTVSVTTKPFISDGQISIDGEQGDEITPAVLKLDLGQYVLSIKSDDYFGETTLDCASETILQLEVPIALISTSPVVADVPPKPDSDDKVASDSSPSDFDSEVRQAILSGFDEGGWYTQLDFTGVTSDDSRSNEDGLDGPDLGKISQRGSRLGFEMGYFQGVGLALRVSGIANTYFYQSKDPNSYEPEESSVNGLGAGIYLYLTRWLSLGANQVFLSEEVAFSTISYSPGVISESVVAVNISSANGSSYVLGFELITRSEELDSDITQSNSNMAVKFGYRFD